MRITRSGLFRDLEGSGLDMTVKPRAPSATESTGTLTLRAQDSAADVGGVVEIISGVGATSGGELRITSGAGENAGGNVLLTAGDATAAAGGAGSFLMTGGFAVGAGGTGGSFLMQAGGGDTTGSIYLNTPIGTGLEITDDGAAVKVGLWGAPPTAQATTGITGAAFVVGAGVPVNTASTFGGYTLAQIAAALVAAGVLA